MMGEKEFFNQFDVLELLPNMIKSRDETIVIKYGGNAMLDGKVKRSVIKDIVFLKMIGMKPIVVHGGGPAIDEHMERVGLDPVFVEGHRVTDTETLEIVEMVLCGKVNNELVKLINIEGIKAIGLSGKDVGFVRARKHLREIENSGEMKEIDLGYVGEVVSIDREIIDLMTGHDIIPVIAPIAVGEDNRDYNINADVLAGEIAGALKSNKLIYLTDVNGILEEPNDDSTRMTNISVQRGKTLFNSIIKGGMIPKVESCIKALNMGLESAHVINGMVSHSLLITLLTDSDIGTTFF